MCAVECERAVHPHLHEPTDPAPCGASVVVECTQISIRVFGISLQKSIAGTSWICSCSLECGRPVQLHRGALPENMKYFEMGSVH